MSSRQLVRGVGAAVDVCGGLVRYSVLAGVPKPEEQGAGEAGEQSEQTQRHSARKSHREESLTTVFVSAVSAVSALFSPGTAEAAFRTLADDLIGLVDHRPMRCGLY